MFASTRRTLTTVTVPGNRHLDSHGGDGGVTVSMPDDGCDGTAAHRRAEGASLGWAELAYYKQDGPCPYPHHRSTDWRSGRRWVCGVCHPPAGRKEPR